MRFRLSSRTTRLAFVRTRAAWRLARSARLFYRLMRDRRVPLASRLGVGTAIALIVSPLDPLDYVPVIGEIGALAAVAWLVSRFIDRAPADVVAEHRQRLDRRAAALRAESG